MLNKKNKLLLIAWNAFFIFNLTFTFLNSFSSAENICVFNANTL
jgi:hypothetical protein